MARSIARFGGTIVDDLNELKPGLGDRLTRELNVRITAINGRFAAQSGGRGSVGIAKQKKGEAGLDLNGNRLTGLMTPKEGSDLINLNFLRRFLDCDRFAQWADDCLELPKAVAGGSTLQLFPPNGFLLFVDQSQMFAYYIRRAGGSATNDELAGAIGAIDISDKHNPVRVGYLVLTRIVGPLWFAVDEVRLIAFVLRVLQSTGGAADDYYLASVDLSDPTNLSIISFAPFPEQPHLGWSEITLGNKGGGGTTYGYASGSTGIQSATGEPLGQNVIFLVEAWNLTDPLNMFRVRRYVLGGYHVGAVFPFVSDFGVDGFHFPFCTDARGTSTRAVNISAGDADFNITVRSPVYLNHWDISDPSAIQFLGRVELGLGLELQGGYSVNQTRAIVMWGTDVFALVTIFDPAIDPLPVRHIFGIDCSGDVPVIRTDMVSPCGEFTNLDVYETCLVTRDGFTDVLFDVSDISNFRLVGGCLNFKGAGNEKYRPGYLYQLRAFAQADPDPTKPDLGFTIQHFGDNGIICP